MDQRDLYDTASRAMLALLKKFSWLILPIDVIFDLFDKIIVPILTSRCEVCGHGMTEMASKLQLKFYNLVLRLILYRQSTSTLMVMEKLIPK